MPENHLTGQNGQNRKDIYPGLIVDIVLKRHQAAGILTRGIVKDVLSPGEYHPRGIKVRLDMDVDDVDRVGRVQYIIKENPLYFTKPYPIGILNGNVLGSVATKEQIELLKEYNLNIETKDGTKITWQHLEGHDKAIFNTILRDRELRVDKGMVMGDKPRYCICSLKNSDIIRLQYFQGKDELQMVFDLRRKDLYESALNNYI